jgi:hypothetical protein
MLDLLPSDVYFRFNPYMSHPYTLDETDKSKLDQMQEDAKLYVRENRKKIQTAADRLMLEAGLPKRIKRDFKHWLSEKNIANKAEL